MIGLPTGTEIWIAAGVTDLRRGFTGLSAIVQTVLRNLDRPELNRDRESSCFLTVRHYKGGNG
jgi:hypothetical protein